MEEISNKVVEIYPKKWIKFLRKNLFHMIYLYSLIVIGIILGIHKYYHILFTRIIFYCAIIFVSFYLIYSIIDSYKVPLFLNENYIAPYENKLKVIILGERKCIKFKDIKKMLLLRI